MSAPHATLLKLMLKPERLEAESHWAATAKPYEVGRLRCGTAPALACLPCVVLLTELADGIDESSIGEEEARLRLRYP